MRWPTPGAMLGAMLVLAAAPARSEPFRDSDGRLELTDCATATAWRGSAAAARARDAHPVLFAAYDCAREGEREEALALQALADALPRDTRLFGTDGDLVRVRIALALGERERAASLLRTTSQTLLQNWPRIEDPMSVMYLAHGMQRLNGDLALDLREREPAHAVAHQLLAARAYDLPQVGTPGMGAVARGSALEIAVKAGLAEPMIAASDAILARPSTELSTRETRGITLVALALFDLQHRDEARDLATRLKASGHPEAVANADRVLAHIARSH